MQTEGHTITINFAYINVIFIQLIICSTKPKTVHDPIFESAWNNSYLIELKY